MDAFDWSVFVAKKIVFCRKNGLWGKDYSLRHKENGLRGQDNCLCDSAVYIAISQFTLRFRSLHCDSAVFFAIPQFTLRFRSLLYDFAVYFTISQFSLPFRNCLCRFDNGLCRFDIVFVVFRMCA